MLVDKLDKELKELREDESENPVNEQIIAAVQASRDKLFKHYDTSNWIYCAILILDPRHKVERFDKTTWGREMATHSVKVFERMYKTSYYVPEIEQVRVEHESINQNHVKCGRVDILDVNSYFDDDEPQTSRVPVATNRNESLYPTLARMARDLLSIKATSVAAERTFSRSSLIIRKHRNNLSDESARCLMCLNSWVTCSLTPKIQSELEKKQSR